MKHYKINVYDFLVIPALVLSLFLGFLPIFVGIAIKDMGYPIVGFIAGVFVFTPCAFLAMWVPSAVMDKSLGARNET